MSQFYTKEFKNDDAKRSSKNNFIVAESLLELNVKSLRKSESSKPKFKPKGNGEGDKDKGKKNGETQKAKMGEEGSKTLVLLSRPAYGKRLPKASRFLYRRGE